MNSKLLIIGSKNFNNTINEVKEYLNFSFIFIDFTPKSYLTDPSISAIIVDSQVLDIDILGTINKIHNKLRIHPYLLHQRAQMQQDLPSW